MHPDARAWEPRSPHTLATHTPTPHTQHASSVNDRSQHDAPPPGGVLLTDLPPGAQIMHAVDPDVLREALNTLDLCSSALE